MEESTQALFRSIADACRQIGSANDLQDRGDAAEAQRMRDRAQRAIADALEAASADDRERIQSLFGPDPMSRFDQISWCTSEDYIQALLARDPELPVAALRLRQPGFLARIEDLRSAPDARETRLVVRYTRAFSPSLFDVFRKLVERSGDPVGCYWVGRAAYHLNLAGEGFRYELRERAPEPHDLLIDGVFIHVMLAPASARSGVGVTLRSRDREALARTERSLRAGFAAGGWEEVLLA